MPGLSEESSSHHISKTKTYYLAQMSPNQDSPCHHWPSTPALPGDWSRGCSRSHWPGPQHGNWRRYEYFRIKRETLSSFKASKNPSKWSKNLSRLYRIPLIWYHLGCNPIISFWNGSWTTTISFWEVSGNCKWVTFLITFTSSCLVLKLGASALTSHL